MTRLTGSLILTAEAQRPQRTIIFLFAAERGRQIKKNFILASSAPLRLKNMTINKLS
ncbi:hypothetical protein D1AOALGA4SA_2939 [Olavius algarvensis Delta 1 endosymbiont]|nr:hypothetical protein D1AOALGA4SA_2939 [Olavius algarvensis Delta 1 endosymbiont]